MLIKFTFWTIICSVLGAVLIVIGLYSVLWGLYKEYKEKEERAIQESVQGTSSGNHHHHHHHHHSNNICQMETVKEDIVEANDNDDIEMQKKNTHELAKKDKALASAVTISVPLPQPPIIALPREDHKNLN